MNRQQRRLMEKLKKKSDKELMADLKKMYPNMDTKARIVGRDTMDYKDFINQVQITPQMAEELKQYEADERLKSQNTKFDIYNKD